MKLGFAMGVVLLAAGNAFADEARCISAYGKTACGYSCQAAPRMVSCTAPMALRGLRANPARARPPIIR